MLNRFRRDPLIGNVLALIALFIALGAGAYAAGLAPNSVKSKHIVDGQVKTQDLANQAVQTAKIAPDSITSELVPGDALAGIDIDESTLGSVPNAASALNAGNANQLDGQDSSDFQAAGTDGWTNLDLNDNADPVGCHWVPFNGGFATPSYFRDNEGIVHLRGLAKAIDGSSNACGTVLGFDENIAAVGGLPPGYVPDTRTLFTVSSNNLPGRVDVFANGTVGTQPGYPTTANTKQWVSLDGISFRCGPSGSNGCP